MSNSEIIFEIVGGNFSYRNHSVLQDINLQIKSGKFYGLIGPNGSGKTTLLDLLMATRKLLQGTLEFRGRTLEEYDKETLAKMLALVPQDFTMGFAYSVYDIVLMGRHPHIPRFAAPSKKDLLIVEEALTTLDISHLQNRSVTDLSGGEKQRVVVARALAQNTPVLILDEATSSLDIQHTIEIMRVIRQRVKNKGMTVVAAIHDLNLAAAFCDKLIVLKDRKIHSTGKVDKVLNSKLLTDVFSVQGCVKLDARNKAPRVELELR